MAPGQYVVLPSNASCQYIAEGAANIVYRISLPPGTPPESNIESYGPGTPPPTEQEGLSWYKDPYNPFEGKLLRVRKDLPTTVPCEVSHDKWTRLIAPMFPDDQIINQTLVELKSSKIIDRLNEELKGLERPKIKGSPSHIRPFRPLKRNGIYLADDNHGLLVTDMSISGDGETLMEFKPKWLTQSPSAPSGSLRCRGCAKFAKCNAESASNGKALTQAYFCPLDLISEDPTAIDSAAQQLAGPQATEKNTKKVAQWLKKTKLLENLRNFQKLDRKGVMKADVTDENFLVAMTLRDCSVFVRLPDNDDVPVEARIGDLDLKSPDKAEYWKSVERPLIEEGWYRWEEKGKDRQPNFCALNKHR